MKIEELIDNDEIRQKVENISENDIVTLRDLGQIPENASFRAEAYIILICEGGRGAGLMGGKEVEILKNDLVFVPYQQIISNVMTSLDFKGRGFMVSANYLENMFLLTGKFWPASIVVKNNPVVHLNDKEMKRCLLSWEFLESKLNQPRTEHYTEMMQLLLRSMIYDFYDQVSTKIQLPNYSYTSAENIFTKFLKMAEEETPRQREVGYYANRLCITPKYLSVICKQSSGKTASTILNTLTVEYIKTQLRSSDKTVKEIANEAGFENLSFFGKYVKKKLGVSPREYRIKRGA